MRRIDPLLKLPGIYQITCLASGKRYIGSAIQLARRRNSHFGNLRRGAHPNPELQAAWRRHGSDQFAFQVLLVCSIADLMLYEQLALDGLKPEFNRCPIAFSTQGRKYTPIALANVAAGNRKRAADPAFRAMRSAIMRGNVPSAETRARLSAALKGRPRPPEVVAKMKAGWAKRKVSGRKLTAEERAERSRQAKIYMNRPEVKAKISASLRGRNRSRGMSDPSQGVLDL